MNTSWLDLMNCCAPIQSCDKSRPQQLKPSRFDANGYGQDFPAQEQVYSRPKPNRSRYVNSQLETPSSHHNGAPADMNSSETFSDLTNSEAAQSPNTNFW